MKLETLLQNISWDIIMEEIDLPNNPDDWPNSWNERYIERAAIMEFDGGLGRSEAEKLTEKSLREENKKMRLKNFQIPDTKKAR